MTIKITVKEERKQLETLGEAYLAWYDKRVSLIKENSLMSKEEKRKEMRKIFKATQRRFSAATNTIPARIRKKRVAKNPRKVYLTFEDFETAVLKTLPPQLGESAMNDAEFYVFPLEIFYTGSVLPPTYFVEMYEDKFGVPPANSILYRGQGMHMLALGAVTRQVEN